MTSFHLAVLNLLRHRFRTIMTIFAIALPVVLASVLLRLNQLSQARFVTIDRSVNAVISAKAGELDILLGGLNGEGDYPDFIPKNLFETLRDRHVAPSAQALLRPEFFLEEVIPITIFGRYESLKVIGTDQTYWQRSNPQSTPILSQGRPPAAVGEVAVAAGFAQAKGLSLGSTLSVQPWVTNADEINRRLPVASLQVVGIFKNSGSIWDQFLICDLSEARAVLAALPAPSVLHPIWRENVLHYMLVNVRDQRYADLERLINQATVAQVISVEKTMRRLEDLTGNGQFVGTVLSGFILVLGGVAVIGLMATRFDAMTHQLTILRAIGYGRAKLMGWLLWEGLLLGSVAVLLSAVLDVIFLPWFHILSQALIPSSVPQSLAFFHSYPVWIAAILATIAAACIPFMHFWQRDIHSALREI